MAIVKWLPFVNSYIERQKRIVELRSECVKRGLELKIERIEENREKLRWHTIHSIFRLQFEPLSYQSKRRAAEMIYAINSQTARELLERLDIHKRYLQCHYDLISDEKILEAESKNPTFWC